MTITIDGGILAGGLSTRMLGEDKGLQRLNGQTMASAVYQALVPHVNTLYINCNQNQEAYQSISPNICADTIAGFQGPLAGIVSLMSESTADYLLISPCDTPHISNLFGHRMLEALENALTTHTKNDTPLLFAAKDANRNHPLHMLVSRQFLPELELAVSQGLRRVMQWVNRNHVQWVDFSDHSSKFSNFNSPEALLAATHP